MIKSKYTDEELKSYGIYSRRYRYNKYIYWNHAGDLISKIKELADQYNVPLFMINLEADKENRAEINFTYDVSDEELAKDIKEVKTRRTKELNIAKDKYRWALLVCGKEMEAEELR